MIGSALLLSAIGIFAWWWLQPSEPLAALMTLAGAGARLDTSVLSDPFGLAVDQDDNIFVSDGKGGRIYRVTSKDQSAGEVVTIAERLEMPSAIVVDRDGTLIVANTGAQTISRIDPKNGSVSIIAGTPGVSGFADGRATEARFNGPVGVAVRSDGAVIVADTYNDCIRIITREGQVSTLAGGGEPGFGDGPGSVARFDTPCGVAIAPDGSVLVADTGNHRVRRIAADGTVTTMAGTGEATERDGHPLAAAFAEPTAIAIRDEHSFYVADAAGNAIRLYQAESKERPATVSTIAGGWPPGLTDGSLTTARLNRPVGLAIIAGWKKHTLVFADSGNGLVRAFVAAGEPTGFSSEPEAALQTASEIRAAIAPRWPYDPPDARREIAGTFGEVRGEIAPDHDAWFHNGFDIPGGYGETVRAIHTERVIRPLSVDDAGGGRERIRLPLLGYIHLRIGRDQHDQPFKTDGITLLRDAQGKVSRVRVRRGTTFSAGQPLGTLNRLNHVHLIAGPTGGEINALAALQLPGITDTIAPIIEKVSLLDDHWQTFAPEGAKMLRLPIKGRVRVIVQCYDQADGNAGYRRLGIYKLSYAVLKSDGSPAPGFEQRRENIVFEKLPMTQEAVKLVYAPGSQSGYSGKTIFAYLATNVLRDGAVREDFLDTEKLPGGDYVVRVIAEDFFGNKTARDVTVTVKK